MFPVCTWFLVYYFRKLALQKQKEYLKKRKQKKQARIEEQEQEREKEKKKWLNFSVSNIAISPLNNLLPFRCIR